MIDHTGIVVRHFEVSREFYIRALAPIGYALLADVPADAESDADAAGFGEPPKPAYFGDREQLDR